jgi:hypothetical protein
MYQKILAELRKKHAGLSAKVLGLIATNLAKKVTDESEIEGKITELENLPISLKEFADMLQSEGDRRVTEALKKPRNENDAEDEDEEEEATPPAKKPKAKGDSALAQQVQQLTQMVQNLTQAGVQKSLTEKLHAQLKDKKIPLQMAKGVTIEKEEDIEAAITQIESDYTDFKQELVNQGLAVQTTPAGGNAVIGGNATEKVLDADIAAWAGKSQDKK